MSTDRELLELAAKAAGHVDAQYQDMAGWGEARYGMSEAMYSDQLFGDQGSGYWNPLVSDSDAFRLAVKLHISVAFWKEDVSALLGQINMEFSEPYEACHYAATRRAIVRAAAEIGRQTGDTPK